MAEVTICSDFGAPMPKKALTVYTYSLLLDWVVEFLTSASLGSHPPPTTKLTKNPSQGQHLPLSQPRYREWSPWILPSLCVSHFAQCLGGGGLLCGGEQLTLEKFTSASLSLQTFGFPLPHHIRKVLTYSCPAICAVEKEREGETMPWAPGVAPGVRLSLEGL